jgi:hypothetical protein
VNTFVPDVAAALDAAVPPVPVEPRWDDVLRRAGIRRRRARPRALVAAAVVAVAAAVLAAEALTIAALAPGEPRVSAHVVDTTLGVDATFSAHPRGGFWHVGSRRWIGFARAFRWTLTFEDRPPQPVTARLRVRGSFVTLCRACPTDATGTIQLGRRLPLLVLERRGRLTLSVAGRGTASANIVVRR